MEDRNGGSIPICDLLGTQGNLESLCQHRFQVLYPFFPHSPTLCLPLFAMTLIYFDKLCFWKHFAHPRENPLIFLALHSPQHAPVLIFIPSRSLWQSHTPPYIHTCMQTHSKALTFCRQCTTYGHKRSIARAGRGLKVLSLIRKATWTGLSDRDGVYFCAANTFKWTNPDTQTHTYLQILTTKGSHTNNG